MKVNVMNAKTSEIVSVEMTPAEGYEPQGGLEAWTGTVRFGEDELLIEVWVPQQHVVEVQ